MIHPSLFPGLLPDLHEGEKPWRGPRLLPPSWFRGGSAAQRRFVAAGLHPLGQRLARNSESCGSCGHLRYGLDTFEDGSRPHFKCWLQGMYSGPSTDVRAKWPACSSWIPQPDQYLELVQ